MGRTSTGPEPPHPPPEPPQPLLFLPPPLLTIYHPREQPLPPVHPSPSRFWLHHAGHWPLHPTRLKCPRGGEQDSGGTKALLQDPPVLESNVEQACRGSRAEKIHGQNQCIGTLMERSDRFGNFSMSVFNQGLRRRGGGKKQLP